MKDKQERLLDIVEEEPVSGASETVHAAAETRVGEDGDNGECDTVRSAEQTGSASESRVNMAGNNKMDNSGAGAGGKGIQNEEAEKNRQERLTRTRRDRIKNAIIAFLVVLLILTFFSNTWMNRTLPEVATAYVEPGSISPKVRGTGTVEADNPYKVVVKQTRKVSSVLVHVGDTVAKGDTLFELEDEESEELTKAEKDLADLKVTYEKSLFDGTVPDNVITDIRNDVESTPDEYQTQLKTMQARYDAAVATRDAAKAAKRAAENQYASLEIQYAREAGEVDYNKLTPEYTSALATYEIAKLNRDLTNTTDGDEQAAINSRIADYEVQIAGNTKDETQLATYQKQMQLGRDYQLKLVKRVVDDATKDLEEAESEITKMEEEKKKLTTAIAAEITLTEQKVQIDKAEARVEKLLKESIGTTIDAPVDGIITSVGYVAGETTNADTPAAVIQVAGRDMMTSFSVTNAQARKVHVGDAAEPQNAWFYSDFKATLSAIKTDPSDPAGKKILEFKIASPEVQAGQSVSIQIGQTAQDYDLVVPNSAIRDDNNGKFILIVQQKASPLGNRYTASRVDVEVQESDDTYTAITGALSGYEYVITTSSEPIRAGQYVRLSDSAALGG
ncbi:MAG: HlyD family efflux transporter periplasmic adaptor subunit [Lachnospiraceae bacterium]|nr:HlyD family efflux transporter periplasmic adaptor subunit [Lachnospiraceae bacterium]